MSFQETHYTYYEPTEQDYRDFHAAHKEHKMRGLLVVNANGLWNGDDFGNEWPLGWRAYPPESPDQTGYQIYSDDGYGNGEYHGHLDTAEQVDELFNLLRNAVGYEDVNAILTQLKKDE